MKVQVTLSHRACRHGERESDAAGCTGAGWELTASREGRQKQQHASLSLPSTACWEPASHLPAWCQQHSRHSAHFLLLPLSAPRSLLNAPLLWFWWYSWISLSAAQGQAVGVVLSGSIPGCGVPAWHRHRPGWAPGIHSPDRAGQSHLHVSPVTEQHFLVQELFLQSRPFSSSRDYKAHQILLHFLSPWSPSYTQTISQTS